MSEAIAIGAWQNAHKSEFSKHGFGSWPIYALWICLSVGIFAFISALVSWGTAIGPMSITLRKQIDALAYRYGIGLDKQKIQRFRSWRIGALVVGFFSVAGYFGAAHLLSRQANDPTIVGSVKLWMLMVLGLSVTLLACTTKTEGGFGAVLGNYFGPSGGPSPRMDISSKSSGEAVLDSRITEDEVSKSQRSSPRSKFLQLSSTASRWLLATILAAVVSYYVTLLLQR